ncbi:MAG: hypothetical protein HONDAALG_02218 [Gammaproteobacteria bacterium]|nr:hypothetical protein [Gammaproteobacteria bacterium]
MHVLLALVRVQRQGLQEGPVHRRRQAVGESRGRRHLRALDALGGPGRTLAGEHVINGRAERVDVGAGIGAGAHRLLGRAVAVRHRPAERAGLFARHRLLGDAEVDEHDPVLIVEQDVSGLQIAMHDGRLLRVHVGEHVAELPHPRRQLRQWHAFLRITAAHGLQRAAAAEFEHQVDHAVADGAIGDVGHRGMIELGEYAGLVLVIHRLGHFLQRAALVAELHVLDQVGRAEAAASQQLHDTVAIVDDGARGMQPSEHALDLAVWAHLGIGELEAADAPVFRRRQRAAVVGGLAARTDALAGVRQCRGQRLLMQALDGVGAQGLVHRKKPCCGVQPRRSFSRRPTHARMRKTTVIRAMASSPRP